MTILGYLAQFLAASIMLVAGVTKFIGTPEDMALFAALGMEPFGRFLIGGIEVCAALLLIRRSTRAFGALLAVGVMCGAMIAHITHIGLTPGNDGGKHMIMLAGVLLTSGYILIRERHRLPIIGNTL